MILPAARLAAIALFGCVVAANVPLRAQAVDRTVLEAHHMAFAFDPLRDLLALHYDHAPDKDDGHSAAADRTILESLFNKAWIEERVAAVSGTYGENREWFDSGSDPVMDAAWSDVGGWYAAHPDPDQVLANLTARWLAVLEVGGDVWVKEGSQSDLTAEVVRRIRDASPDVDTRMRIHVVQHSLWNEDYTTDEAFAYVREHTDYIRIRDANAYLMFILGLGELDVSEFQERFLQEPGA